METIIKCNLETYIFEKIQIEEVTIPLQPPVVRRQISFINSNELPKNIGNLEVLILKDHFQFEKSLLEDKPLELIDIALIDIKDFNKIPQEHIVLATRGRDLFFDLNMNLIPVPITHSELGSIRSNKYNLAGLKYHLENSEYLLENIVNQRPNIKHQLTPISLGNDGYLKFTVVPPKEVLNEALKTCLEQNNSVTRTNLSRYIFNPFINNWLGIKTYQLI